MYIFNSIFTAKAKSTGNPFFKVKLFKKMENKEKQVYFKEIDTFIEEETFNQIKEDGFNFGDIVELKVAPPEYFGGTEQLVGLKLVTPSPYVD